MIFCSASFSKNGQPSSRPFQGQTGTRTNIDTGEQLTEASPQRFVPGDPNDPFGGQFAGTPYYPPGSYGPPGAYPGVPGYGYGAYPPGGYMQSSPYAYGSPYDQQAAYGFSEDYWGTQGDSPYGWQYGNSPAVTYQDLYGDSLGPLMMDSPFGISEDDTGEELIE